MALFDLLPTFPPQSSKKRTISFIEATPSLGGIPILIGELHCFDPFAILLTNLFAAHKVLILMPRFRDR